MDKFDRQVDHFSKQTVASKSRRFAGQVIDGILVVITFYIGWIVVTAFLAKRGQTPGKAVLGIRVIDVHTREVPSYGTMFVRDQILTGPIGYLLILPVFFALADPFFIFGGHLNQTWKDQIQETIVVHC